MKHFLITTLAVITATFGSSAKAMETNDSLRDNLYSSYDLLLNNKYKIKVNENTLDRIKNYFK